MSRPRCPRPSLLLSLLMLSLCSAPPALSGAEAAPARVQGGRLLAADGSWHALEDLGLRSAATTARLQRGFLAAGPLASPDGVEAEGDERLALVRIDVSGIERLPLLPTRLPVLREPLPLVSPRGELVGAAWLEGSGARRLAVFFAPWEGVAWGPAEEVAPPAAGSQLALTGTVSAGGSILLAWSAFDGEDDEILWTARKGTIWSPPRRLGADNSVPDITPALHALGGSGSSRDDALATWSRYLDGQYRVVLARFDGRTWSEPRAVGPPGSLFPGFEPAFEAAATSSRILFRTATPRGWQAVEVDSEGRPRRTARVSAETAERPRLVGDGESSLRFVWPTPSDAIQGVSSTSVRSARWEVLP